MSTNINNTQVNDVVDKKRYLDSNSNLSNDRDKYPQPVVTLDIKIGKEGLDGIIFWHDMPMG